MADLYNLDAEIEDYSQQEEVLEEEDDDGNLDENETINDNDDNDEAADAQVPAALRELAAARHKSHDDEDEDSDALEEDLLNNTNANPSATTMAKARERLCDLAYTRLYRAWSQECRAPELLPWDRETVDRVTSMHDSDGTIDTGNANMDALLTSLLRIDAERGKFLLADLLKRRLQKIEAHAFFYDNNNNINTEEEQRIMSEHEVRRTRNYL